LRFTLLEFFSSFQFHSLLLLSRVDLHMNKEMRASRRFPLIGRIFECFTPFTLIAVERASSKPCHDYFLTTNNPTHSSSKLYCNASAE
jgi:hypothetical protein